MTESPSIHFRLPGPAVSAEQVRTLVEKRYKLPPGALKQHTNRLPISHARQLAMFLLRKLTGKSLSEIGLCFGGFNHTTVLHSIHKIEQLVKINSDVQMLVQDLTSELSHVEQRVLPFGPSERFFMPENRTMKKTA